MLLIYSEFFKEKILAEMDEEFGVSHVVAERIKPKVPKVVHIYKLYIS